jgi:hypothetical protein
VNGDAKEEEKKRPEGLAHTPQSYPTGRKGQPMA